MILIGLACLFWPAVPVFGESPAHQAPPSTDDLRKIVYLDKLGEIPGVRGQRLVKAFEQITLTGAQVQEDAWYELYRALLFLDGEFGSPSNVRVTIQVTPESVFLDRMTFISRTQRHIIVSKSSFAKFARPRLAHEIYHACFQSCADFESGGRDRAAMEAEAAYAQFRYQFRGKTNKQIRARLRRLLGLTEEEIKNTDIRNSAWEGASRIQLLRLYVASAWRFLEKDERALSAAFRSRSERGRSN